jgi:hypothetical protein
MGGTNYFADVIGAEQDILDRLEEYQQEVHLLWLGVDNGNLS